eukprot:3940001-Prymnesium_polylepis.1
MRCTTINVESLLPARLRPAHREIARLVAGADSTSAADNTSSARVHRSRVLQLLPARAPQRSGAAPGCVSVRSHGEGRACT